MRDYFGVDHTPMGWFVAEEGRWIDPEAFAGGVGTVVGISFFVGDGWTEAIDYDSDRVTRLCLEI